MRQLAKLLLVPLVAMSCAAAARGSAEWSFLGQQTVTDRVDHDVIVVTAAEGRFDAIQFRVQRAAVDFHKVAVHFRNGERQEVELRATIRAGGASRRIDLTGDDRVIQRVEFWYDARTARGRQAVVRLFGDR